MYAGVCEREGVHWHWNWCRGRSCMNGGQCGTRLIGSHLWAGVCWVSGKPVSLMFPFQLLIMAVSWLAKLIIVYVQVAQGAKMCGASMIIGVDMNPAKEEVGKSFPFAVFYIARCRILLSATWRKIFSVSHREIVWRDAFHQSVAAGQQFSHWGIYCLRCLKTIILIKKY